MFDPADTIVAIATPPGRGGIGLVRISGRGALRVGRVLLGGARDLVPRYATLARVHDSGGRVIDEVVATFFAGPQSYTAEDVVEIGAHGSPALLREIVRAAVRAGARLAEPGEFTLRSFLNGRLDLVQAEAVGDLVDAVTPLQAHVAFDQLDGTLTQAIGELDRELFDLAARLEASLDFPEEGYHFVARGDVDTSLRHVCAGVARLLESARHGRVIRDGRRIAIIGKPNVGKSSLFNWLVGSDRAIVADAPGTTRDLVTESVDFEGIRLALVDTAGIRDSADGVEREGVARARRAGAVADVILLVCDISRPFDDEDRGLVGETAGARRVVVCNKADLVEEQGRRAWRTASGLWAPFSEASSEAVLSAESAGLTDWVSGAQSVRSDVGVEGSRREPIGGCREGVRPRTLSPVMVSLKMRHGLDELRGAMRVALECEGHSARDTPMVTNLRHESLLRTAHESLIRAIGALEAAGEEVSEELVLADIAEARRAFEEVTGGRTADDVLRHIFSRFCVGK